MFRLIPLVALLVLAGCTEGHLHNRSDHPANTSHGQGVLISKSDTEAEYVFTYDSQGKHYRCKTPVQIDSSGKPVPAEGWNTECAEMMPQGTEQTPR